ncbi:WD40 repeat domain-containing protein [Planktothrix sp. FACHB-1375]|uniref:WD40 repeat domain-containing protein n=2 Tax=Oscillatoriophycideae TaxID=1301283 RepID=A0A926VEP0_9CYAN|nr:WD40 repeat domain-containing protein [Aerosakkonema funiforme]MBD2182353.1 WD40 repeat domain-containing protein [Aerosakkonema funiforme FACHB-1375]
MGIYQQILQGTEVTANDSQEHTELILSGLIVKYQGYLKVKNPIYASVFNQVWVASELGKLRPYSQTFDAWIASQQTDESRLLRGQALKDAQIWSQGKSLSDLDYQFLAASVEFDSREVQLALEVERSKAIEAQLKEQQQKAKLQKIFLGTISVALLISSGLGLFAFIQYGKARISDREARISEIKALASSSEGLFVSHRELDAMIDAIKAKRRLQNLKNIDVKTIESVENALNQTVYSNNEYNRLIGHKGSVLSVDISPDNQLIVTGSNDKTVKIWKLDGTLLQTLKHTATVHRVAFSPDSRMIVSGSLDGSLKLWGVDGKLIKNIPAHQSAVWGVAFSPDGKLIASASGDGTVKLWKLNGKLHQALRGHQKSVWSVAFSPNSQMVASAGFDSTVKLWSIDGTLLKTLEGHKNAVWDVAFCPSQNLLVSVSADYTAKIWQTDGKLVKTLKTDNSIVGVDCKGEYIATSGRDNFVKIWKINGTFIRNLKQHQAIVRDVALSTNGLIAASASDDGKVKLWKRNKYLLKPLYVHKDTIWDLATSKDGKLFASVSGDDTIKLWSTNGLLQKSITQKEFKGRTLTFSTDSRIILAGDINYIQIWNLKNTNDKLKVKLLKIFPGNNVNLFAIAVTPDRKMIASGGDNKMIKLWDFQGNLLTSFFAHNERIWKLGFSSDGKFIASASEDGTVKIWHKDGKLVRTLRHNGAVWGMAFSPQGNLIVTASRDDTLNFWRLDGKLLKRVSGKSNGLTRVTFSPDGKTIATGGVDNTVKLWSITGELLHTLPGHEGMVISLDFTADGNFLVSGGDDGLIIIWDLKQIRTLNNLDYACNWVRDYLRTNVGVEESDRHLCDRIAKP